MSSGPANSQGSPYTEEESLESIEDLQQRLSQLPDLVLSTLPSCSTRRSLCPPRVPPRKYKKKSKVDVVDGFTGDLSSEKALLCSVKTTKSLHDQSWVQVGKELRTIADDFRFTHKKVSRQKIKHKCFVLWGYKKCNSFDKILVLVDHIWN